LLNKYSESIVFKIEEISRAGLKSKKKDKIFYTEISVNQIPEKIFNDVESSFKPINFIKYQPVSEFPTSTRDFSFSIKDFNKYEVVIDHLSKLNDKYLKDAFIFDFYENKKFNEIKVGVRFIFQSSSATLSEEEVHKSVNKLLKPIVDLEGVSVPGM
jgi:phenylalanyl-tRNA synthetase beta subunit